MSTSLDRQPHPLSRFISPLVIVAALLLLPRSLACVVDLAAFALLHYATRFVLLRTILFGSKRAFGAACLAAWCIMLAAGGGGSGAGEGGLVRAARDALLRFFFAPRTCVLYLLMQTAEAIVSVGPSKTVLERMWAQAVAGAVCVFLVATDWATGWSALVFRFDNADVLPASDISSRSNNSVSEGVSVTQLIFIALLCFARWRYCGGTSLRSHVLPCLQLAGLAWLVFAALQGVATIVYAARKFVEINGIGVAQGSTLRWLTTRAHAAAEGLDARSLLYGAIVALLAGIAESTCVYMYLRRRYRALHEQFVASAGLECPICVEQVRDTALVPCGHLLCARCVDRVLPQLHEKDRCPICRQNIERRCKIYLR